MAPPQTEVGDIQLQLIYRPQRDERLSWPRWLTYSGRFTHISGHLSATGLVQDRESSPAKGRYSTVVPRNKVIQKCTHCSQCIEMHQMCSLTCLWWRPVNSGTLTTSVHYIDILIELRFYVPLNTKWVTSETFFPDNLLAKHRKTTSNTTKANMHP